MEGSWDIYRHGLSISFFMGYFVEMRGETRKEVHNNESEFFTG